MPLFGRSGSPNVKQLRQSRDVEGLLAALTDPTDQVRQAAADALGHIGDARAVEVLITVLTDPGSPEQAANRAAFMLIHVSGDLHAVKRLHFSPQNEAYRDAVRLQSCANF